MVGKDLGRGDIYIESWPDDTAGQGPGYGQVKGRKELGLWLGTKYAVKPLSLLGYLVISLFLGNGALWFCGVAGRSLNTASCFLPQFCARRLLSEGPPPAPCHVSPGVPFSDCCQWTQVLSLRLTDLCMSLSQQPPHLICLFSSLGKFLNIGIVSLHV